MGYIDRTPAWNSIKWMIGHKEHWGNNLPEEFLDSVVTVGKYSADVKSLLGIDMEFQTLYNQKEFIPALKKVCKKYGLFVGRVPKIQESQAESLTDQFPWLFDEKLLKRVPKKQEIEELRDYNPPYVLLNAVPIYEDIVRYQQQIITKNKKKTGNARLVFTFGRVWYMLCTMRDELSPEKVCEIFGWGKQSSLKSSSYRKYFGILQHLGYAAYSSKLGRFVLTDKVVWADGYKPTEVSENDWDI